MRPSVYLVVVILFALVNIYPLFTRRAVLPHPPPPWAHPKVAVVADDGTSGGIISGKKKIEEPFDVYHESGDQLTALQLMQNYSSRRRGRACDALAANVTIALEPHFRLGTIFEVYHRNATRAAHRAASKAYVLMVSNHKYIDGALVMGDSLRSTSALIARGDALLVVLVNEKINNASLRQLAVVFDVVKVMRTTATFSPRSYYKTTFDKMYLFWLTDFSRIIFFDADSLAVGNTDRLFDKLPSEADEHLVAVGGTDYFQTALLVIRPDRRVFMDIYLEFRFGSFGYNQWRARDGILLRNCFLQQHRNIHHPREIYHFYGYIKPWFNKDVKHARAKEQLQFDWYYMEWWRRYERLHREHFVALSLREAAVTRGYVYGNSALKLPAFGLPPPPLSPGVVDPAKYMWLQRFSVGSEYLRPTAAHYAVLRDVRPPGLRVVVAPAGRAPRSCDEVCVEAGGRDDGDQLKCRSDALQFTLVNDCGALRRTAGCAECEETSGTAAAPLLDPRKGRCLSNFLHDPATLPACNATPPMREGQRVCACFLVAPTVLQG